MPSFFTAHAEAFFWVAALLASSVLSAAVRPAAGPIARWSRVAIGAGIPYLALVTGAVSERDTGVLLLARGSGSPEAWVGALVGAAGVTAAMLAVRWRGAWAGPSGGTDSALLDECRWALYRGAAIGWLSLPWLGSMAGLLLAFVEWQGAGWVSGRSRASKGGWAEWTVRAAASTLLFVVTQSLWLTLAFAWIGLWSARRLAPSPVVPLPMVGAVPVDRNDPPADNSDVAGRPMAVETGGLDGPDS